MDELFELIKTYVDKNELLLSMILSNSRDKEKIIKCKIRPIKVKEELFYQAESFVGKKAFHENVLPKDLPDYVVNMMDNFKQLELEGETGFATVLVSKKGTVTIKRKKKQQSDKKEIDFNHNKKKTYILEEGIAVPFLVDLGVMTQDGKIVKARYDKYRQINRYLEFVQDILPNLPKDRTLNIIDFGCGKSYLTFALYYYLKIVKEYDIRVIGLDLKEDVIANCNELAKRYGYDELHFEVGDIAKYAGEDEVDMVVTLHACDTATDYAIEKAVKWNAKVILCVPCCQHEVNKQIKCDKLDSILKYGLIKERMSALITDALRANLLENCGYETQILEFIDMEHTPKNILIRAVKTGKIRAEKNTEEKIKGLEEFLSINPTLQNLLEHIN